MRKCILGGILGGIILFVWGALSWMALPWHMATLHPFKDEKAVSQVIQSNAAQNGMYLSPLMDYQANQKPDANAPMVFASVHQGTMTSMGTSMFYALLTQIVAAFLVTCLVLRTNLNYFGRVGFVVIFALAAGVVTHVPYWIWFSFDTQYTLVEIGDLLIGWLLAGLAIAGVTKRA